MRSPILLLTPLLSIGLLACGIGGPGDNNNNNLMRPEAGVNDSAVDAGNNNNQVPVVQSMTVQTLRSSYLFETLGQTIVDVRPMADCQAGHIPDGYCVPLNILWDGTDFQDDPAAFEARTTSFINPLIFYGTAAMDATVMAVAERSLDIGYTDVYVITGGFEAWMAEGWYRDIERHAILDLYYTEDSTGYVTIADDAFIVDTMDAPTYAADEALKGHIKCAININGDDLWYGGVLQTGAEALLNAVAPDKANDVLIFYCTNAGCAASEAASFAAEELGWANVFHYKHGLQDWADSGNPVVSGSAPCGP